MDIEPVPIKVYGDLEADKKFKKTVHISGSYRVIYRKKRTLMGTRRKICFISTETST